MSNDRTGLAIGIISRGYVPLKFAIRLREMGTMVPGGLLWDFVTVEGKSWAEARIEVVKKARERGFKYLFYLDDDVLPPPDVIRRLMAHGKDIVTGIYYTKTEPSTPVIFEDFGNGPMMNFELDSLFEIGGAGLGCTLINMDVFDKFDEAGLPFFKENWNYKHPKHGDIRCPIGEDHYFFIHAKKLGYKVWCDSSILCDHWCLKTNKAFPPESVVRDLTGTHLDKIGKKDERIKQEKQMAEDPDKKTVVFLNHVKASFSGDEDKKRGIGGSEGDIIFLAREFHKKGYNVHVFCNCPNPGMYEGVRYHDINKGIEYLKRLSPEYCIVSRNCNIIVNKDLKKEYGIQHVNLWLHDMPDSPANEKFDEAYNKSDSCVALSKFHAEEMFKAFPGLDRSKMKVIPNGVTPEYFFTDNSERDQFKLLYTSTPLRGLELLLKWWPEIKKEIPGISLDVYSSMRVYGDVYSEADHEFETLYAQARSLDGVNYLGTVTKEILGNAMRTAGVLAYPTPFLETCCVTAYEAQASGLPIVTSNNGALPETIHPKAGILIPLDPVKNEEEYKRIFIRELKSLTDNPHSWGPMSKTGPKYDHSWKQRVDAWETLVFSTEIHTPVKEEPSLTHIKRVDANTKRIAFVNFNKNGFTGDTYESSPMGGSESAIVLLSREFVKKGYEVKVFCNCSLEGEYEGVGYHNVKDAQALADFAPEVCIVSRNAEMIALNDIKSICKTLILWVHDLPQETCNNMFKQAYEKVDWVISPSQFLVDLLCKEKEIEDPRKFRVIGNGVDTSCFNPEAEKDPFKLMYYSVPFKGLHLMPNIFKRIKEQIPQVTLDVYSSMNLYGDEERDKDFKELFEELERIEGVSLNKAVTKKQLGEQVSKASILCYPNHFRETFGIVAAEAQYAGLPVISSMLGALPEVCDPRGCILIEYDLATYEENFVNSCVALLKNQQKLFEIRSVLKGKPVDWSDKVSEWEFFFDTQAPVVVNSKTYWDEIYRREIERGKERKDTLGFQEIAALLPRAGNSPFTVLDVGCGTGELCEYILTRFPNLEVWGMDLSETAITKARGRLTGVKYSTDLSEFKNGKIDYLTCCHTLEHLETPEEMLESFKRLLSPSGTLIVVLPYKDEPYHEHFEIYDEKNSIALLERCGYTVRSWKVRKRGMFYKDGREFEEIIIEAKL